MQYLRKNKKINEAVSFAINLIITFLALIIIFRLWNKDIYVPIAYQNDGIGAVATIKSMIEGYGIWNWPYWSAPYGETYYLADYILPVCIIQVIIIFVKDAALAANIFWLATYFLTALTSYMLFRKLGIRNSIAVFGSVIYNFLPFHYFRIEHFWLCGCYVIPLALWIILDEMGHITYQKNVISIRKLQLKKNMVINVLFAILIGLNGIYYAVFTVMLLLISCLLVSINQRKKKYFLRSLFYSICIFVPIVIFYLLPSLLDQGRNLAATAATRNITDIERYSLKLFSLFFPIQGHRIPAFAEFTKKYSEIFQINNESYTAVLGLIMSIGLVISILAVFCKNVCRQDIIVKLGLLNVVILLIACTGGMANYIGIFLTSAIRCFNRMSVFIALNAIAAVCVLIEMLFQKVHIKKWFEMAVIGILIFIGLWDQTSDSFARYSLFNPEKNEYQWSYEEKEKEYHELIKYFDKIEEMVGAEAVIYQMPQTPYYGNEKSPFVKMKAYVCSKSLKWTYAVWYTEYIEWQNEIEKKETVDFLNTISLMDMSGILIDKNSYESEEEFRNDCKRIKRFCKEEAFVDYSGSLYFFDITDYKRRFLSRFQENDIRQIQDAIKDEVDGVEINAVAMDRLATSASGENRKETIYLKPGDLQYGPYINLSAGAYRVTLFGKNLSGAEVRVTADLGNEDIEIKNISFYDDFLTYEFELSEFTESVEFLAECQEDMMIQGYYYEKKSRQDYHDLVDYYKKAEKLKKEMLYKQYAKTVKLDELSVQSFGSQQKMTYDSIRLKKDELQYGPYHDLIAGTYEVTVKGKNLSSAYVSVTSNAGRNGIDVERLDVSNHTISYQITLDQFEEDVEFLIENRGNRDIEIENYSYKLIKEADYGIVTKYLEDSIELSDSND